MKTHHLCLAHFLIVSLFMLTGWSSTHHKKQIAIPSLEEKYLTKELDLSLPLPSATENKAELSMIKVKPESVIEKPKKVEREVELNTEAIMSPYPEEDKIKSFDGAAITINVKR